MFLSFAASLAHGLANGHGLRAQLSLRSIRRKMDMSDRPSQEQRVMQDVDIPVAESSGRRRWHAPARRAALALLDVYGLYTSALILTYALLGESFWVTRDFANLMPFVLVPAIPLLLLGLAIRRWRMVAFTAPAAVVFLVLYGAYLLPKVPPVATPDDSVVRLMTYNVLAGQEDAAGVARNILEAAPEVVVMQELDSGKAGALEDMLAEVYPHQAVRTNGQSVVGRGVFSRLPLSDVVWAPDPAQPVFVRFSVNIDGEPIAIYNTHLAVPGNGPRGNAAQRSRTLDQLLAQASAEEIPVVLMGDFNMADRSLDYARLVDAGYTDAYRVAGAGLGPTFPYFGEKAPWLFRLAPPLLRIDYVWLGPELSALAAHVMPDTGGSDHYPLVVDVLVPAG
jgi:vancomycin resistance protein VanJ